MGIEYQVKCDHCGYRYSLRIGGGMDYYLLRCETCGKEKRVSIVEMTRETLSGNVEGTLEDRMEQMAGRCRDCASPVTTKAVPRCPRCHSPEYTEIEEDGKVKRTHYD